MSQALHDRMVGAVNRFRDAEIAMANARAGKASVFPNPEYVAGQVRRAKEMHRRGMEDMRALVYMPRVPVDNAVERVECPECGKVNHVESCNRHERTMCWCCDGIIGSEEERLNAMLSSYEIARESVGER